MRLIRFIDDADRTHFGREAESGRAEIVNREGNAWRATGQTAVISRRLAPIDPPNIFAIGRNYAAHAAEMGNQAPERPLIFMKPTTSVISDGDEIVLPSPAPDEVDYEAELAIVIGRRARDVSHDEALDYVLGYTCANDVSARDCQRNDKQWPRAKGFDTFCPLGPVLVTPDELGDPGRLEIRSRLNGQVMQNSNTGLMLHDCRALIRYLSQQFTLLPGTVILTGTPDGVGSARKPPVYLRAGDVIEVEVAGIGVLRNRVVGPR